MEYIRVLFLLCGCIPRTQGLDQLTGYHKGSTYTLACRKPPNSHTIDWFRNDEFAIRTHTGSAGRCRLESPPNSAIYATYLSGRVNVSCNAAQHNVFLRTTTPINTGSVWQCRVTGRVMSNRVTIETVLTDSPPTNTLAGSQFPTTSGGTPDTSTVSTTMNTTKPKSSTMVVYVAIGAGVGVVVIIFFIVIVVCVKRREGPYARAVSERDMATDLLAPAAPYGNVGSQENERELVENELYEGFTDVTSSRQLTENDHDVTDIYAEVQKPKKARTAHTDKAEYVNTKDL